MPIYEYSCTACDHHLDALQKMSDDPLVDCPECGKPQLQRMVSAPRFRLKGQGWYETDFKKDKQRNIAGDKDTPTPVASTDSTAKPESKAAPAKPSGTAAVPDSKKSTAS